MRVHSLQHVAFEGLAESIKAFHWHADTFDIPKGATALFHSQACQNQGFIYKNRVVALQFHLEVTQTSVRALRQHCQADLDDSSYAQSELEMIASPAQYFPIHQLMHRILTTLAAVS